MSDLTDWLRLSHTPGVGPKTFNALINKFGQPAEIFKLSIADLLACGLTERLAKAIQCDHKGGVDNDLAWQQTNPHHYILTINDALYPRYLRQIFQPPPILYAAGDLKLLNQPGMAIVGTRKASAPGRSLAYDFSEQLARAGLVIVSGLARGIDTQAHRGAISTTSGKTIAVLGSGLDVIYPRQNLALSREISTHGLLVSEFAIGSQPLPQHFPRRNRIISGLSIGVLIIEAAIKSGSLITAAYALEQGREVFAVPAAINNPLAAGCHQLIQQGAKLTTCINDILIELQDLAPALQEKPQNTKSPQTLNSEFTRLLAYIDSSPLSIDRLIEKSGLTPQQVSSMLIQLEIGGHIACDAFGQYSRLATDVK